MRNRRLDGRTAVVTGAARGIGAELARTLAARGARVALLGLEPEQLERAAADCGPGAAWWEADVTDRAALDRVAGEVAGRFGRVDVVVANAGIAVGGPFARYDAAAFDRVVEVNLLGSVATARAFLPHLTRSGGYLLQVASLAALTPAPLMAAYCASKAGVEAFAHSLRAEVAHQGVGVGVAYLSWTETDMVRAAFADEALVGMRRTLPWPVNRVCPLEPAVERLADGIARRAPHVYGQWWLRMMQPVRGSLPSVVAVGAPRRLARFRDALETMEVTGPVGAGGAADAAARAAAEDREGGPRAEPSLPA
ncbi:SDR family oxidoreductase [Streptomyces capparidis]